MNKTLCGKNVWLCDQISKERTYYLSSITQKLNSKHTLYFHLNNFRYNYFSHVPSLGPLIRSALDLWSNVCVQRKTFAPTRANLSTGRESTCVVARVGLRDVSYTRRGLNGIFLRTEYIMIIFKIVFKKGHNLLVLDTRRMIIPRISRYTIE